jgi:hypothetical protein
VHASASALVAFSAGAQIVIGAANALGGAVGLALLPARRREHPVLPQVAAA